MIQARMSSSRFPGKMLKKVSKVTLIEYVYNRCMCSKMADFVVVLTSNSESDDVLYKECVKNNMAVYRGSLNNVLQRYLDASEHINAQVICRVCGDSPFVDIESIDEMFTTIVDKPNIEYVANNESFNGFEAEVFTLKALRKINSANLTDENREHVTSYLLENIKQFNCIEIDNRAKGINSKASLTVDYSYDLPLINNIACSLSGFCAKKKDIVNLLENK
jgi:spore coat polysaccharide biosynthesis protein SpsF